MVAQILDYAKEIHGWSYERTGRSSTACAAREGGPSRLFDLVRDENENIDEAAFVDGVTRNLANGRFLLLVVGDGIREGVKRLAEYLQRLAGVQFTFGLVELAMFELPAASTPGGLIVEPRVLARTVEIERAIVRRADVGVAVEEPPARSTADTRGGRSPRMNSTRRSGKSTQRFPTDCETSSARGDIGLGRRPLHGSPWFFAGTEGRQ